MSAAGDWLKSNWEYVAAGAMVVGGAVLIATGVGGPIGGALISAGIDVAVQKATTGSVNWGEVAVGAVMGLIPGAGAGAKLFAKAGREALSGVVEDTANKLLSGQPITVGSVLTAGITNGVMGNAGDLVPKGAKNVDIPTNSKLLDVVEPSSPTTMYHYTNRDGMEGILESQKLNPSLKAVNPNDARYSNGQYVSDLAPGTRTNNGLSATFIGNPFQGPKFSHYVEIDVTGLDVVQGRPHVFVIPNEEPLDLTGRIVSSGTNE